MCNAAGAVQRAVVAAQPAKDSHELLQCDLPPGTCTRSRGYHQNRPGQACWFWSQQSQAVAGSAINTKPDLLAPELVVHTGPGINTRAGMLLSESAILISSGSCRQSTAMHSLPGARGRCWVVAGCRPGAWRQAVMRETRQGAGWTRVYRHCTRSAAEP